MFIVTNPGHSFKLRRSGMLANESNVKAGAGTLRRTFCYQPRSIGFQVNPHRIDCAHLSPDPRLSQLFHHLVVDEHFPKLDDLNIGIFHLPELSFGQCLRGVPGVRFRFSVHLF